MSSKFYPVVNVPQAVSDLMATHIGVAMDTVGPVALGAQLS